MNSEKGIWGGDAMSKSDSSNPSNEVMSTADLVVIGGGGGLAAGVAAAEKGAKVVILEKRKKTGGNVALATGLMAVESPVQSRMRIDVSREYLFDEAMKYSRWTVNPRLVKAYLDKSGNTIGWLEDMGLRFEDVPYFFHNQGHRIYHIPKGIGARLAKVLLKRCEELGVQVLCETQATRITTGNDGQATGVVAIQKGAEIKIKAKSVLIATGGYSGNRDMLKQYYPYYTEGLKLYGLPSMGEGLQMAVEKGADTLGLGMILAMGPLFEGSLYVHAVAVEGNAVWVNKNGERFIDEGYANLSETANALDRQPDSICYSLFDDTIKRGYIEDGLVKGSHMDYPPEMKMKDLDKHFEKETSER